MKKRFFAAVLALAMVLGLAAPIGLVVPAAAASADALKDIAYYGDRSKCKLTAEQAQAYADLLNDGIAGRSLLFVSNDKDEFAGPSHLAQTCYPLGTSWNQTITTQKLDQAYGFEGVSFLSTYTLSADHAILCDFDGNGIPYLLLYLDIRSGNGLVLFDLQGNTAERLTEVADYNRGPPGSGYYDISRTGDGKYWISYKGLGGDWSFERYTEFSNGQIKKEYSFEGYELNYTSPSDPNLSSAQIERQINSFEDLNIENWNFSTLRGMADALSGYASNIKLQNAAPADILAQIPYYGDRSKCKLTAEQAAAYANMLEQWNANPRLLKTEVIESYDSYINGGWTGNLNLTYAAYLCDLEGNGNPALIVYTWLDGATDGFGDEEIYIWRGNETVYLGNIWHAGYRTSTGLGRNVFGGYSWSSDFYSMGDEVHDISFVKDGKIENIYYYLAPLEESQTGRDEFRDENGRCKVNENNIDLGIYYRQDLNKRMQENGYPTTNEMSDGIDTAKTASLGSLSSYLRAYADAKKYPTYTYPVAEAGDSHYADVTAAVSGQGTVEAIYRLLEDAYYVLLENSGAYTGAVVRGVRENGKAVWKVTQTDPEPAAEDTLSQLVARLAGNANLSLDFGKLRGSPALKDLIAYLQEALADIDGLAPNDPSKGDLAAFVNGAVASLASGAATGKNNRLTVKEKTVSGLTAKAQEAYDALTAVLGDSDVELNRTLTPVVRLLWSGLDESQPCQLTLDSSTAEALDGFGLQALLGNGQTYVQLPADSLSTLTRELGTLSVQFQQVEPGIYDIRFLDSAGQVVEWLSRPVTIGLPASGELSTIVASYAGGSDNWGGQYDAASGAISFETSFSGRYEVLENSVAINDIGDLSEESQAAIAFMVSKGYFNVEDGLFRPGDSLNRYEFTEALVGMFFALDRSLTTSFSDVPNNSPYYAHVASAQAKNIVSGFEDGTFGGEANITREQVFALAARTLMDQKGYTQPSDVDEYLSSFSDQGEISDWAKAQVALAVREGIAARNNALWPQTDISREQAAVVLYRLFQLLYEVSPVALDVPEAAPAGLSTPVIVGVSIGVALLAAGGAVMLLRKKTKAAV